MADRILLLSVLWMAALFLAMEASDGLPSQIEPSSPDPVPPSVNGTLPPANGTLPPANGTSSSPPANETQPPPPPPPSKDPCDPDPCGDGSRCQAGFNMTHTCLCPAGEKYEEAKKTCESAKVFPAEFQTQEKYKDEMENTDSKEFKEVSEKIVTSLELMLQDVRGSTPVVLELQPSDTGLRSAGRTVKAIVEIIFPATSDATADTVTDALEKECEKCPVKGQVTVRNLCEAGACNAVSSSCTAGDGGFTCTCLDGYEPLDGKNRQCIAECPIGQTKTGGECVACDFGYTGFNCEESWERDLLIVGCVLGGLLLVAFVLVIVFATKKPKKSSKESKTADVGKAFGGRPPASAQNSHGYFDHNHAGAGHRPADGFGNAGNPEVPRIPRAATNGGWGGRTNLEMTPSHSRQNLIAPARPANNPYAQNRPQASHYAPGQGHGNPYYM